MISFSEASIDIEKVKEIIKVSGSIRDALYRLNVRDSNFAYKQFRKFCEENEIEIKFSPQNRRHTKYRKTDDYLVENSNHRLNKERLIREGILERKCSTPECPITEVWLGKKIVLELDHINGDSSDNRRENIRLLCPNCHSQTPTSNRTKKVKQKPKTYYCSCGEVKFKTSKVCKKCDPIMREKKFKTNWPENSILIKLVADKGFSQTGKILGVSDNAVRKRMKTRKLL